MSWWWWPFAPDRTDDEIATYVAAEGRRRQGQAGLRSEARADPPRRGRRQVRGHARSEDQAATAASAELVVGLTARPRRWDTEFCFKSPAPGSAVRTFVFPFFNGRLPMMLRRNQAVRPLVAQLIKEDLPYKLVARELATARLRQFQGRAVQQGLRENNCQGDKGCGKVAAGSGMTGQRGQEPSARVPRPGRGCLSGVRCHQASRLPLFRHPPCPAPCGNGGCGHGGPPGLPLGVVVREPVHNLKQFFISLFP